jgi:hypothetical protein
VGQQSKQKESTPISEILLDKIRSRQTADSKTDLYLQSAHDACVKNIKFIKKIIHITSMENTLLKDFIESEGLYDDFIEYAKIACEELELQEIKKRQVSRNEINT